MEGNFKVGIFGTVFAALCCLGFPVLISLLSAVGLGFLIDDSFLFPILGVSLVISVVGLFLGVRLTTNLGPYCWELSAGRLLTSL